MLTRLTSSFSTLSPDAVRLNFATALTSLPIGYLIIVLPIYFNKVGLDPALIGQLYAVSGVTSALLLVVFGLLADRFGRKPFVMAGLTLPAVSYGLFLVTTHPALLTLAAGIGGIGFAGGLSGALSASSFSALLAEKSSDENRTLVFSIGSAAWTGALMAGSLLSGLPELLQNTIGLNVIASYQPLFGLSLLLTLSGVAMVWPIQESHTPRARDPHVPHRLIPRQSVSTIVKLSVAMGLIGLGLGFSIQLLSLWFYLKFNVSGDVLGPWYALSEALSILAVYIVPKLAKKIGTTGTVLWTQGLAAIFLAAMPFAPHFLLALIFYVARNFLMNLSWPAQQSYIMGVTAPSERATAGSLTNATWGLGSSISPPISGLWLDQGLLSLPLLASASSYLLSAVLFYGFFRHVRLPEELTLMESPEVMAELEKSEI